MPNGDIMYVCRLKQVLDVIRYCSVGYVTVITILPCGCCIDEAAVARNCDRAAAGAML